MVCSVAGENAESAQGQEKKLDVAHETKSAIREKISLGNITKYKVRTDAPKFPQADFDESV